MTIFFANDSNPFLEGNDLNAIQNKLNEELENNSTSFKVNRLSLNIGKSQVMTFTCKKVKDEDNVQCIEGPEIENVRDNEMCEILGSQDLESTSWTMYAHQYLDIIAK